MIASFAHNFIFIKTRKTAGTSVEVVLSTWCSDEDVCVPILPEDELIRAAYGARPRNFGAPPELERSYVDAIRRKDLSDISRLRTLIVKRFGFYAHMPATDVRDRFPELWQKAFKFTIERHPYEKIVSRAYWKHGKAISRGNVTPISDFIEDMIEHPGISDRHLYMERDQLLVDRIIPYESLWSSLGDLARTWGVALPDPLPRSKGGTRQDRRPARDILTRDQRRRIADRCAFEFELMGYER
jgi:hypothetical protein